MPGALVVVTANVNGIRAADRRGGLVWLAERAPDIICLQEVRATHAQLHEVLAGSPLVGYHVAHSPAAALGRAGVAVLSKMKPTAIREGVGHDDFADAGRWIEVDLSTDVGPITAVSAYIHTGEAGTPKQDEKLRFLDAVEARLDALRRARTRQAVVTGDFNVAHREVDIKNWRANRDKAGFLPEERTYLDRWFAPGRWVDLGRTLGGPGPGPYTWWSWRGRGFDTDGGWRIDYQIATPTLAERAVTAEVGKAAAYAERWSDHAPLTVTFA